MFDVFIAPLQCSNCNSVILEAEIQTYLRGSLADSSALGIGFEFDPLDLDTESLLDTGYALVNPPPTQGSIRLLEVWNCPNCRTEQWAMVEIADRKISNLKSVKLNRSVLESANFISDVNAGLLAKSLKGEELISGESSIEILRRLLP